MKKFINKYFTKKNLVNLLVIFIIIQPILDLDIFFQESIVNIFGFSPSTIIRLLFVGVLLILMISTFKFSKKHLLILLYLIFIGIYTVFHHLNALNFESRVPGNFNYSFISELFYIIRMIIPIYIIWISYQSKIKDEVKSKIIVWLTILISGSIVITNFLKISLGSYTSKLIKANFFQWFTDAYDNFSFYDIASKGFFNFANQISALLLLLTPLLIYNFIKKQSKLNIILLLTQILAMFMLGTKVATYGVIGILIVSFLVYLYFCIINKQEIFKFKVNNIFILFIIICCILLPYSPAKNRELIDSARENNYDNNVNGQLEYEKKELSSIDKKIINYSVESTEYPHEIDENIDDDDNDDIIQIIDERILEISKEVSDNILIPFIRDNYEKFSIHSRFVTQSYPYQYDPYFWYNIMKKPLMQRTNYRYIEEEMLKRVMEINNRFEDKLFGITYIRMQNIFPLERDFQSHYYSMGIIGLVLLALPYVLLFAICGITLLVRYKEKFNMENILMILGIGMTLFAAFYSGNVMDGLVVTIILTFILGQLARNIFPPEGLGEK